MLKNKRIFTVLASAALALVMGAAALFTPSATVQAQTLAHGGPGGRGMGMMGFRESDTYLAQALNITSDELTAAKDAAWTQIVDQALADGLITEAQATSLKENSYDFHGRGHGLAGWLINEANVDFESALAAELNITADQLSAARETARELQVQAAVDAGEITADEASTMLAHMALRTYIDRETMLANALGITVDDLQTARQNGTSLSDLLTASGKSEADVTAALKIAVETAVAQAVADGKITQAQADAFLADSNAYSPDSFYGGPGRHGMGEGMMGGRGDFGFEMNGVIDRETILANVLGITTDELQTALQSGKTLSDLISASGKSEADVTAAVKAALTSALEQAVTDGKLTQTQADAILANFSLNSFCGFHDMMGPGGMDGMMGPGGRHGRGGDFNDDGTGTNSGGIDG